RSRRAEASSTTSSSRTKGTGGRSFRTGSGRSGPPPTSSTGTSGEAPREADGRAPRRDPLARSARARRDGGGRRRDDAVRGDRVTVLREGRAGPRGVREGADPPRLLRRDD